MTAADPTTPAAEQSAAPEFAPAKFVCKGHRYARDDRKMYTVVAEILPDETLGEDRLFLLTKTARWVRCGYTYTIEATPDRRSMRINAAKFEGTYPDEKAAAAWEMEHDAETALFEADRENAKPPAELRAMLLPLRRQYSKTIGTGKRIALELAVLNALRAPLSERERR